MCLTDSILLNVSSEDTAYKIWRKIGEIYQTKSLSNKLYLKRCLYSLKMKDGESIAENLNAFNLIISQLASIDVKIEDEDKCILLICSLPESWEKLVIAITSGGAEPKLDTIIPILLLEEMRRKTMRSGSQDALHV